VQAVALSASAREQGADFVVVLYQQPFEPAVRLSLKDGLQADLVLAARSKSSLSAEESRLGGARVKVAQVQSRGRSVLRVDLSFTTEGRVSWLKGSAERDREVDTLSQRTELMRAQVDAPGLPTQLKALKQQKLEDLLARREALAATPLPVPQHENAAWARVVPLEPTVPGLPKVAALVTAYDRDVGALNLA
jgi:2',3'-cyclic-nucleotide 2'-phosphodiesterase (5'-nucleotidase family)